MLDWIINLIVDALNSIINTINSLYRSNFNRDSEPHLRLYIRVFQPNSDYVGANATFERIASDIETAKRIWGIKINYMLEGYPNPGLDASYITFEKPVKWSTRLFNVANTKPREITVFYVPGTTLGSNSQGRAQTIAPHIFSATLRGAIFLTDTANSLVFAHELGHILFTQVEKGNVTSINPGSEHLPPSDNNHSTDPNNLMYPFVTSEAITPEQRKKAALSPFVWRPWSLGKKKK
ncbi:hypothetical protein [Bacillus cereus]|uniref:hypothetical protein n=1 Tax=Bacillus cereus TaxID=1396 RepID=UPI00283AA701|nr:hypothetical protein [Bacillus cereus]